LLGRTNVLAHHLSPLLLTNANMCWESTNSIYTGNHPLTDVFLTEFVFTDIQLIIRSDLILN